MTDELYYGGSGRIVTVVDLASALAALEEIVEQGEGLQHQEVWDGDRDMFHPEREEVAHYFRFHEIHVGPALRARRHAAVGPDRRAVRGRLGRACTTCGPNPRTADYPEGSEIRAQMDEFNHAYSGVLHLLRRVLQRQPAAARGRDRARCTG